MMAVWAQVTNLTVACVLFQETEWLGSASTASKYLKQDAHIVTWS